MPDIPHATLKVAASILQNAPAAMPQPDLKETLIASSTTTPATHFTQGKTVVLTSPPPTTTNMGDAVSAEAVAQAIVGAGITTEELERQIERVLRKHRAASVSAATTSPDPKTVDWSKISEKDLTNPDVFIPVIEHEIPDYMNMRLKDDEYLPVWASKDQRRLGQLFAEGYEFLKPEHVHPDFKLPLLFDGEKLYRYVDVVCLRVHKRIIFGKRKRALLQSVNQLKNTNRPPRVKQSVQSADLGYNVDAMADEGLNMMFKAGKAEFYDPAPV